MKVSKEITVLLEGDKEAMKELDKMMKKDKDFERMDALAADLGWSPVEKGNPKETPKEFMKAFKDEYGVGLSKNKLHKFMNIMSMFDE